MENKKILKNITALYYDVHISTKNNYSKFIQKYYAKWKHLFLTTRNNINNNKVKKWRFS